MADVRAVGAAVFMAGLLPILLLMACGDSVPESDDRITNGGIEPKMAILQVWSSSQQAYQYRAIRSSTGLTAVSDWLGENNPLDFDRTRRGAVRPACRLVLLYNGAPREQETGWIPVYAVLDSSGTPGPVSQEALSRLISLFEEFGEEYAGPVPPG